MPRNPRTFTFEGAELTAAEIHRRVPALSETAIRLHLAAGRNTAAAMLTYRPQYAKPTDASRYPKREGVAGATGRADARRQRARDGMRRRRAHPEPDADG